MSPWRIFEKARRYGDALKWLVGVVLAVIAVVGWAYALGDWATSIAFPWLRAHALSIWLILLSAAVSLVCFWAYRLRGQLQTGFRDKFQGDLSASWDFRGEWRIPEKGTLLVTGGEVQPGKYVDGVGLTKIGAQWENYSFSFRARIINRCLGVVVRAQDMRNYYMLQIAPGYITPHRQVSVPVIGTERGRDLGADATSPESAQPPDSPQATDSNDRQAPTETDSEPSSPPQREPCQSGATDIGQGGPAPASQSPQAHDEHTESTDETCAYAAAAKPPVSPGPPYQQVEFLQGWVFSEATPLATPLADWFDAKVTVRGQAVLLYIDGELALHKDSFLQNSVGKVGFRNWGPEEALVRDVRVRLER